MTSNSLDGGNNQSDSSGGSPLPNRRQFLTAMTAATGVSLTGCSGGGSDGENSEGSGDATGTSTPSEDPGPAVTSPPSADCEGMEVSSDITTDTTWSAEDCPVVVLAFNIGIRDGETLTIEPGVQVVCRGNTSLIVETNGTLKVAGQPSNPVWFYGDTANPDHWRGLIVKTDSDNRIDNAVVRHAGLNHNAAIAIQEGAHLSMTNTLVADCAGHGMTVDGTIGTFEYNAFRNNGRNPIALRPPDLGSLDAQSLYAGGNENDAILVPFGTVEKEATWSATDAPYRFRGRSTLQAPVTVQPGAHLTFAEEAQLFLQSGGSLTAEGTEDAPIIFEGDPAEPGTWRGITLTDDTTASVENAEIAHGGVNGNSNLTLDNQSEGTVRNSLIRASTAYGIYVGNDATLDQSNNTFENNDDGDLGGPGA